MTGDAMKLRGFVLIVTVFTIATVVARSLDTERRQNSMQELARVSPQPRKDDSYSSSGDCQSCHPGEHSSWHRTYHRTMTQLAVPGNVLGDFDDVRLTFPADEEGAFAESRFELTQRGDEYWVTTLDPTNSPEPREQRIVMTTGSHHIQTYWVEGGVDGELKNVPLAWLIADQRWVPRSSVLITPRNRRGSPPWNVVCISCHSTGGQPGMDRERHEFSTKVAELGISCDSCHGSGREHIALNQDPRRRHRLRTGDRTDDTIINPARLTAQRSSEVCAQCHSATVFEDAEAQELWLQVGDRYRAGEPLTRKGVLLRPKLAETDRWTRLWLRGRANQDHVAHRFWPDGIVRVAGLNYSAMIESACNDGGEFSCLSCHSMHDADPDDLLTEGMDGDAACLQCHESDRYATERHTHHGAGSSGSRCYNCHMPHTTWGLTGAIRTHWIHSPTVQESLDVGRPNACNLCHVDQTLEWTGRHLQEWYGQDVPEIPEEHQRVAAVPLWLLKGDAGLRGLAAWHMGWDAAHEASGSGWQAPLLSYLLDDPYEVVRYRALKSLQRLPGFEDFDYDFVGTADGRRSAADTVRDRWSEQVQWQSTALDCVSARTLIDAKRGELLRGSIDELRSQRDDRPVALHE